MDTENIFRLIAGVALVLVAAAMASCTQRMNADDDATVAALVARGVSGPAAACAVGRGTHETCIAIGAKENH